MEKKALVLLIFTIMTTAPGVILAADKKQPVPTDKVPVEYLEEMEEIYQECEKDGILSKFYDCRCKAVHYIDEKMSSGPETNKYTILEEIKEECVDTASIAGNSINECRETLLSRGISNYEELCECFANTYAREFAKNPQLESRNLINIKRDAYVKCGLADEMQKNSTAVKQYGY